MTFTRHIFCLLASLSGLVAAPCFAAQTASEAQVKAAILFNLARFSSWSDTAHETPEDSFRVCTRTKAHMLGALSALSGKTIHDRELSITHLANPEDATEDCEVLFISSDQNYDTLDFEDIHESGVLTIGDSPDFLARGGCMSIQRHGKKLKFSINPEAMKKAGIRPSSKILTLAVEPET